ncbi:MAG: DNA translocase FtsK, partial [Planctomycetaceae bacterium]|nr:DNA translocase FtsK [Planctomycetaceae bacterium]
IDFLGQYETDYSAELSQVTSDSSEGGPQRGMEAIKERDELYEQAIEVVVREGRGSVSLLQRALGIGYGRGARLIDYMAEDGIVGDYNGSQAREVKYTADQWEAMKNGEELEDALV